MAIAGPICHKDPIWTDFSAFILLLSFTFVYGSNAWKSNHVDFTDLPLVDFPENARNDILPVCVSKIGIKGKGTDPFVILLWQIKREIRISESVFRLFFFMSR